MIFVLNSLIYILSNFITLDRKSVFNVLRRRLRLRTLKTRNSRNGKISWVMTICEPASHASHASHANFAFKSKHPFQIALINSY